LKGQKSIRSSEGITKRRERDRIRKREIKARRREQGIALLGGKCAKCGSTDRLEFDHIDPATKSFALSSHAATDAEFFEELKKCQLLCYKHHREKSGLERRGEQHPLAKLTTIQVLEIRQKLTQGAVGRRLAEEYGVDPMQISRIKTNQRWKVALAIH
jgi:5-methylcytosine-specific restriction endonuclease McrA